MADADRLTDEQLGGLLREIVARTVKQYRIAPEEAERLIGRSLAANVALRKLLTANPSPEQLQRSRAFRQAVSEAKRQVYYRLRSYTPPADDAEDRGQAGAPESLAGLTRSSSEAARRAACRPLLERHASTRERLATVGEFYDQLFGNLSERPESVVDIGCGMHPLMFPFERPEAERIARYVALDRAERESAHVAAFAGSLEAGRLLALHWDLAEGWSTVCERAGRDWFDLALMMKLVPVVARRQRELLATLAGTPARTWFVTGSRISMTKRLSIERRERRVLGEFLRLSGREVRSEFVVGEEFAWIVQ